MLVLNAQKTLDNYGAGTRVCPNQACRTFVFVVYQGINVLTAYPVARIDFDTANVPLDLTRTFDEALTCHANECWMAAGMLIRKTIEQLCADRGATTGNLVDKIKSLRTKVTLPDELFDAADHLRLLGNDAAHVEARAYNQVGKDEVEAGIELAKELIKAVYQYKGLVARLLALKKPPAP
jgi:hypothetical protein